jgi:hypothetical protein
MNITLTKAGDNAEKESKYELSKPQVKIKLLV